MMLVIRSNANTPINENTPKDALGLSAYLAREQYGDWPLLKGPYYNAPVIDAKDGNPVYNKDHETGKYVITNPRTALIPIYDPEFTTIFPRMHSGREESHVSAYKQWGKVKGRPIEFTGPDGKTQIIEKPTFGENLRFFFSYQVGHMYMRYFMWNFAGRQNDIQGHGGITEGNWLSGINFIDQIFLGPRYNVPDHIKNNPGHNKFYMLPLILGLIGFFFHVKRNYKDTIVVGLLFILTGLAIIVYLNQTPYQPRERDYAYAASFYAFAIWIGLGVMAISDAISKYLKGKLAPILTTIVTLALVPGIMAAEGWDDHDRSNRYTARDIASNYLESCAPNAIIFTNGDNDTFPLWYVQEVENMRPDIKIVNLSLLNTDWYIDYMIRHKTYDAEPLPFTMKPIQYRDGTRDMVYMIENENITGYTNLMDVIQFVASDNIRTKVPTQRGPEDYLPTKKLSLPVDSAKVVANGTVAPEDAHLIVKNVEWKIDRYGLQKNHLMALDFLATNNWDRPVYFAITTGGDSYLGLEEYFQLEGMAYRLVPIKHTNEDGQIGRINTSILYNNVMNKFKWGNMNQDGVYMNEDNIRLSTNIKNVFARLALALISENRNDSAIAVLDKAIEMMPENKMPFNYYNLLMAEAYYKTGAFDKGNAIIERMIDVNAESL
ncbi:MAG: tetratricopeptide repeat protein, partial [Bacteroidales bacterium]|nr:tetratricopeptide repeat protein [Bacteroidales bacterium]